MKARVNPFTREVILDNEREELSVQFTELDEWHTINFKDGSIYDVHFYYEDVFELSAYAHDENGWTDYTDNSITKINIEY
jgi:hypothetical protein